MAAWLKLAIIKCAKEKINGAKWFLHSILQIYKILK